MKYLVLVALFSCTLGANLILPRVPLKLLLQGNVPFIDGDRIVGGQEVVPNSLPFQISFQNRGLLGWSVYCGGSIYNENWIITAAHCTDGLTNLANYRIVAAEHQINAVSGLEQIRSLAQIIGHENYISSTVENDIALIRLDSPLELNDIVSPIALPNAGAEPVNGTIFTVSGWGTTTSGGLFTSNVLRSVQVAYVDDETCNALYGSNTVYPSMICAGDLVDGGEDSCQGDSGGPLFTTDPLVLIGVVSWGQGCADARYPGVYTQVSYYIDWIKTNTNTN